MPTVKPVKAPDPQPAEQPATPEPASAPELDQPANPQDQQMQPATYSEPGEIGIPAE